jgi:hypothetical protein
MRSYRKEVLVVAAMLTLLSLLDITCAATVQDIKQNYELVDLSKCKKSGNLPPVLPKESDRTYNAQRRYLDLDGSGLCAVMDFCLERLAGDPSPGMRNLEHRFYRYADGQWKPFESDIGFYPYAIRLRQTNRVVLVEAADGNDVGDDMVSLGLSSPRVFTRAGWSAQTPGIIDSFNLDLYQGNPGPVLQALAVLLTVQLQSGGLPKDELSVMATELRVNFERKRIRWLVQEANRTIKPDELVPLDRDGLPATPPADRRASR